LLTLPNGVAATYGYSTRDELASITFTQGNTTLGTVTYTYNAAGRRAAVGGTWARTGLPAAVASATYDDANRQLTWGGQALTYDDNGNLTGDGTNTYTVASGFWGLLGRPASEYVAGAGARGRGERRRRVLVLPTLPALSRCVMRSGAEVVEIFESDPTVPLGLTLKLSGTQRVPRFRWEGSSTVL
jgi:hypothetical protein